MSTIPIIFAKLAALYKELKAREDAHIPGEEIFDYVKRYRQMRTQLVQIATELYDDVPYRQDPLTSSLVYPKHFYQLIRDLEYIFEVRANSELSSRREYDVDEETEVRVSRVFISHGRSADWREVQSHLEKDLKIDTLELAQQPNRGRTVLQKLDDESDNCSFAVVVMTGDDDVGTESPRARENVLHEIGFFQGKFGLENICLLHEEGTNIPSNIHGLVYIPFPKGLVSASFGVLARELRAALDKMS